MMRCFLLIAAVATSVSADQLLPKDAPAVPAPLKVVASTPKKTTQEAPAPRNLLARDPALVSLGTELAALRQRRANILQLEKSIGSTNALIKEGAQMARAASSKRGRQIYEAQVKNTERLQHETM